MLTLIREHRRQHHVNSLHSSMSSVPCGQRIEATASLTKAPQSALWCEEAACVPSRCTCPHASDVAFEDDEV